MDPKEPFEALGLDGVADGDLAVHTPIDGTEIARLRSDTEQSLNE